MLAHRVSICCKSAHLIVALVVALGAWPSDAEASHRGHNAGGRNAVLRAALGVVHRTDSEVQVKEVGDGWAWLQILYYDEEYPLTIDIVGNIWRPADRVIYMLPAAGMNFESNYFVPRDQNLVHFFRENDYLVIGVTGRADSIDPEAIPAEMATWGVEKQRQDLREIVTSVRRFLRLPYELLAFSFASPIVLDYAAIHDDDLQRVIVLEFYSIAPEAEEMVAQANLVYDALDQLIGEGVVADPSLGELRSLISMVSMYPDMDSGVPREPFLSVPGNFTLAGMLHFWLIYSAYMPGLHTHLSGLPRDWPLILGTFNGFYAPAPDPVDDEFGFYHIDFERLSEVTSAMGTGILPIALTRDLVALSAYNGAYTIPWEDIDEELVWVNFELGYGGMTYGAYAAQAAGNDDVKVEVVEGYSDADGIFGFTARDDVWVHLLDD